MTELKGKKLLILAGAAVHCKVVQAAREMGVYTIVTDYLENSPAKKIADESWLLNITDIDGIVERCKKEKIDGVLNFCIDPAQIPYQKICKRLNFPCYGDEIQFFRLTNKPAFKSFCMNFGLDVIPEYSEEDIKSGLAEFPVFVKPSDSRGSRGQSVCHSIDEVSKAIELAKRESSNGEAVIEKYMEGKQDFSMTYIVCNGKPYLSRTCDRYLGKAEDRLNKQCIAAIAPSRYSEVYMGKIDKKVRAFIQNLGITNGPVFMQGFIDGDTIRFYDPGLRFPGGEFELFLDKATNVNLMKSMVEFALTGSFDDTYFSDELYHLKGMHSVQLDFTCRAGKIRSYIGLEKLRANKNILSVFTRYHEGSTVPNSGDIRQRVCEVGMLIPNNNSVGESIKWVQSVFDVLDEDGNSMLISLVNPDNLNY